MRTWTDLIYKARAGRDRLGVSPERSSMGEGGAEARELGPVISGPEDYAERMERLLHDFLSDNSRTMP